MFFIHPSIKRRMRLEGWMDGWRGCSFVFDIRRLCMSAAACYFLIITAAQKLKRSSRKKNTSHSTPCHINILQTSF